MCVCVCVYVCVAIQYTIVFSDHRELDDVAVTSQDSRVVVGSGDLTLSPVTNGDEGTYTCMDRNVVGFAEATVTLTVFGEYVCVCVCVCVRVCVCVFWLW